MRARYAVVLLETLRAWYGESWSDDARMDRVSDAATDKVLGTVDRRLFRNGDDICNPMFLTRTEEGTMANVFSNWLSSYDYEVRLSEFQKRAPANQASKRIDVEDILAALSLAFIDAAVAQPERGMALLADAATLLESSGHYRGWHAVHEMRAQTAARVRHAANHDRRARAIALYKTGSYSSKDAAASHLSEEVGVTWRTARDWLKGLKPPSRG
ncbi:hypothetical protein [Dyella kyungheensis]|uniref:Uncharacterized protein n=1 Tax=Dyella kyungheensis TaxID=1242174 RepID=A0ABS2JS01_9GAMM|nr:hypothetical protein [Dyella kyungheensis]MBM7121369.1 hypothetical protein [Dyella kyungheensis]